MNLNKQSETIINEVKEINSMRQKMITQTDSFQKQLDTIQASLEDQLAKYKQVVNPKFSQISEKSIAIFKCFLADQQRIIENLQKGSENNLEIIQNQLKETQIKLYSLFGKSNLAVTLAKIQLQSQKIQSLLQQTENQIQNDQKKRETSRY